MVIRKRIQKFSMNKIVGVNFFSIKFQWNSQLMILKFNSKILMTLQTWILRWAYFFLEAASKQTTPLDNRSESYDIERASKNEITRFSLSEDYVLSCTSNQRGAKNATDFVTLKIPYFRKGFLVVSVLKNMLRTLVPQFHFTA